MTNIWPFYVYLQYAKAESLCSDKYLIWKKTGILAGEFEKCVDSPMGPSRSAGSEVQWQLVFRLHQNKNIVLD